MAQLKDLIVNGSSRLIGDAFSNDLQITTLRAHSIANGSTYTAGSNGDILMSDGTSAYWGTAAAAVNEASVTAWGFTKNTGDITGVTANAGLTGGGTSGAVTIGHSNASITAKTTQALYPIKFDAYGHITGSGTAVTSLPASDVSDWAKATTKPTYTYTEVGAAPSAHSHGNLTSDGKVTATVTIGSGDRILVTDSSDSSKVIASGITFGTSTTTYLTNKGTWATPTGTTYSSLAASSGGTSVSLVTNGEKYTWNNKSKVSVSASLASGTTVGTITIDGTTTTLYCNTDTKVTQAKVTTSSTEFPVILAFDASTTTVTNTLNKTSTLKYNPNTQVLSAPKLKVTETSSYGPTLPTSGVNGQLFFQISDETAPRKLHTTQATSSVNYYLIGAAAAGDIDPYISTPYSSATKNTGGVYYRGSTGVLYGAAWNDYAEYRKSDMEEIPFGRVVIENGDDTVSLSTGRLQPCGQIVSDTFGFILGPEKGSLPVALCGRVLAYPNEDRNFFDVGDAVCSGPNGTVSKMTRDEIQAWPDRILGYVSSVPKYDIWEEQNIEVDGRIWIKVK